MNSLCSFHQPVIKYLNDTNVSHLRDSFLFISRKIFSFKFDIDIEHREMATFIYFSSRKKMFKCQQFVDFPDWLVTDI